MRIFLLLIGAIGTFSLAGCESSDGCVEDESTEAIECPTGNESGSNPPAGGGGGGGSGGSWSADYVDQSLRGTVDGREWILQSAIYERDLWKKGDPTILDFSFMAYKPSTSGQSYCSNHAGFDVEVNRKLFGISVKDQAGETNFFDGTGEHLATVSYTRAGNSTPYNVITDQVKIELLTVTHPKITGRAIFEYDDNHTLNGTFEAFQCDAYHARGKVDRSCLDADTGVCHEMSAENYEDIPSCKDLGWQTRFSSLCGESDIAPIKGCKKVAGALTTVSWYPKETFTEDAVAADCTGEVVAPNFTVP